MERCLYCYKELTGGERDFHKSCSKKIFGTPQVPLLPYTRANIAEPAREVIRSQTTLTGVQEKLSLDIAKEGKGTPERFTIVGLWGRYILKPQTEQYPHLPELEDLTMHMAEAAKMQVVPHSLVRFADGELCYITRRIDRGAHGEKYPMEDLCQLSERLTEHKYKGSYEQIAKAILRYSAAPKLDVVNFWEQVLFSWLAGNADMHLKNLSLYSLNPGVYGLHRLMTCIDSPRFTRRHRGIGIDAERPQTQAPPQRFRASNDDLGHGRKGDRRPIQKIHQSHSKMGRVDRRFVSAQRDERQI